MVPDRGPATLAVTIVLTVVATVFVGARFYTRIWLTRSIKRDDWWILAAWVLAVALSASICAAVKYGLGRHRDDIADGDFAALRKAEYAFSILYNPALMLTKTSIVVFFLSVMSRDVDPVFKWCNWLTLALVDVAGLALTCYNIFQCRPVAAGYLYPTPADAKCTDIVTLYLSSAPVNIITDIAILFLPMPILTGMRLPRKQKVILVVTFSFGAFVAVVDVVRIAYLQNAALNRLKSVKGQGGAATNTGRIVEENDFSWYASLSFMWSAVEVCIGIICACVPSLKPLFLRFLPRLIKDVGDGQTTPDASVDLATVTSQPSPKSNLPKGNVSMLNNPAAFRRPSVKEYLGADEGDQMGFLNMLSATATHDDDTPASPTSRKSTRLSRRATNRTTASDFGFVKMNRGRNMLKLSNRQSVWPNAVVSIVFFLWGSAYGLLKTLNSRFQLVVNLTQGEGLGLHAAYYAGYLVGPLTLGRFILKRYGFKASMIVGLCVYGCGTLVFWPSAVLTSYGAFIVSNFIVGCGLSCLEIAANPYIALCGPPEYAEVRLNLAQAFQAIGSVCSPLLATKVLFKNVLDAPSLVDVQWTYLGIALFVFGLAVIFYYISLPEASDEQLEELVDRRSAAYLTSIGPWKVVYVTLGLAVFSQWCYVGLQECVGNSIEPLITLIRPHSHLTPSDFDTVAHTLFMAGRFMTALLDYLFKPRYVLLMLYSGMIVCLALNMNLGSDAGAGLGVLTFLFESGIFANVFAIPLRGLGAHTKTGSALMTAAISGGAVFPPVQWAVSNGHGLRYSYCVPLAVGTFGMVFPIYLTLSPAAKVQVDPTHPSRTHQPALGSWHGGGDKATGIHASGLASIISRWSKNKPETPSVEHVEQQIRSRNGTTNSANLSMDASETKRAGAQGPFLPRDSSKGYVADLVLWPTNEVSDGSASTSRSTPGVEKDGQGDSHMPPPQRQRPTWADTDRDNDDEDDDNMDDYHAVMRKI